MSRVLEICCFGFDDAQAAIRGGAQRIELCSGQSEGGVTPSYGLLEQAQKLNVPVMVMIRPRGGDFCYSPAEIEQMCRDIAQVKILQLAGVVFGALNPAGGLDQQAMQTLMKAASGLEVTFHRAFDMLSEPVVAYQQLGQLGVKRVLTSGQRSRAVDGEVLLRQLMALSGPTILAGGGVRAPTLPLLLEAGMTEFHSAASQVRASAMTFINTQVSMGALERNEYQRSVVDENQVRLMVQQLALKA